MITHTADPRLPLGSQDNHFPEAISVECLIASWVQKEYYLLATFKTGGGGGVEIGWRGGI